MIGVEAGKSLGQQAANFHNAKKTTGPCESGLGILCQPGATATVNGWRQNLHPRSNLHPKSLTSKGAGQCQDKILALSETPPKSGTHSAPVFLFLFILCLL